MNNSYRKTSLHEELQLINQYSTKEAEERFKKGISCGKFSALSALVIFFIRGILRKNYPNGNNILIQSFLYTLREFLTRLKLLKLSGKI